MPQREEESLIDEMRATIRADRERAAARVSRPAEAPVVPEPAPEPELVAQVAPKRLLGRLFGH
jgi:hypothetical protein